MQLPIVAQRQTKASAGWALQPDLFGQKQESSISCSYDIVRGVQVRAKCQITAE